MKIHYTTSQKINNSILTSVQKIKSENPSYTVIDIGGYAGGWSTTIADMIVDKNVQHSNNTINMDICRYPEWDKLLHYVNKNGKYDYAICTHTLEDVYNPFTTLDLLPHVAKKGIITMPSIFEELSRPESPAWIGYIHHRWIVDKMNDHMLIIPKLQVLTPILNNAMIPYNNEKTTIAFEWDGTIPYSIFMDNYLGPTSQRVINEYINLLSNLKL